MGVVDARPEVEATLAPEERFRRVVPAGGSGGNTPNEEAGAVMQELPYRTTSRGATCFPAWMYRCGSGLQHPAYYLSQAGLRWWQFDVGKEDGDLGVSGKCRV